MEIRKELLRQIPKVDEVLARPAVAQLAENGRSAVTQAVRQLCIDANCHLGEDVKECIRCSRRLSSKEISPSAR